MNINFLSLAQTWFITDSLDLVHDQHLLELLVSARMVIITFSIPEIQASDYNYVVANI